MTYLFRLVGCCIAFGSAMNVDKVILRVIGVAWLLFAGAGFIFGGITHETLIDIVLGLAILSAAGYSWWYTRR